MRTFPRTVGRHGVAAIVTVLLASGVATIQLAHADDLKDKQKQVDKQVEQAEHQLSESSSRLREANLAMHGAEVRLGNAQAKLHQARTRLQGARVRDQLMAQRLVAARAALLQARSNLTHGRQLVEEKKIQVGNMVADYYASGDPHLRGLGAILNAEDPRDITRQLQYMSDQVGLEDQAYDNLRAAEVLLTVTERKVERAKEAVVVQRRQAATHLVTMRRLEARAATAESSVRAMVAERAEAKRHATWVRAKDRQTLRKLERQQQRIERILRERAEAARRKARNNNQSTAVTNPGGVLSYPVNGRVTSPFGYRYHPIYGYYSLHNGVDFGAGCGAPMYAAGAGRVMNRYHSSVWGNRLIVDHGFVRGRGLATIYNHATNYVVSPGQQVRRGQLVGYVGTTGWSTGCHLHFTVMADGTAVNPMNWF